MDYIDSNRRLSSSPATTAPTQVRLEPPARQQNPNNLRPSVAIALNFGNANSELNPNEEAVVSEVSKNDESLASEGTNKLRRVRPPSQVYNHIMAERKRREQMSRCFLALSSIVPGLKKMDKASVLGDTVNYLKHLQERLKTLEEQAANQTMVVKKSQIVEDEDEDEGSCSSTLYRQPLPEVEARVSGKSVLLKIHCKKRKGVLVCILSEIEKLNLAVVNISVTAFGDLALEITITAEVDEDNGISVAAKDIVKTLRAALVEAA